MSGDAMPATEVKENARLEMLRVLAYFRDWLAEQKAESAAKGEPDYWGDGWVPLFAGEPQNSRDDVRLAAKECAAIGHILTSVSRTADELLSDRLQGPMVCITDAGYDWIRAHDALGEASQERHP